MPDELVFDSTFTTYAIMSELNSMGIKFITLRRRSPKVMDEINGTPRSAWRRIELENVSRTYRTPRVLESKVQVTGYDGLLRQFAVRDLGHELPTILITNHLRKAPATLIGRYARRMLIGVTQRSKVWQRHDRRFCRARCRRRRLRRAQSFHMCREKPVSRGCRVLKAVMTP